MRIGWRVAGDFHQRLVTHHAIARHIQPLRLKLAPRCQLAQQRAQARLVGAPFETPPHFLRIDVVGGGIGQHRHFLLHPFGAPGLQLVAQFLIDRAQMADIAERIHRSVFRSAGGGPIGEAAGFIDLGVRPVCRPAFHSSRNRRSRRPSPPPAYRTSAWAPAGQIEENFHILPRGVKNLDDFGLAISSNKG